LLEADYNNGEAHCILMEVFKELSSTNEFVKEGRKKIKELFLKQESIVY